MYKSQGRRKSKKKVIVTEEWVYGRATFLLEQRDYTEKKLAEKLRQAFPEHPQFCKSAIDKCRESGAVNDERFAESFIAGRLGRKEGIGKIKQAMYTKGFPKHLIDSVSDNPDVQDKPFFDDALALKQSWAGEAPVNQRDDPKLYNRIVGRLARRGFDFGIIKDVMAHTGH